MSLIVKPRLIFVAIFVSWLLILTTYIYADTTVLSWFVNAEPDLAGYKVYYGNKSRSYTTVIDVGNVNSYELNELDTLSNYYLAVTAYDSNYHESTFSTEVAIINDSTLTVLIVESVVVMGQTQLDIRFSEPVEKWVAEDKNSYQIDPYVPIRGGILNANNSTVHLVTGFHENDRDYTLKIRYIKGLASANQIDTTSVINYFVPRESADCDFSVEINVPSGGTTVFSPILENGQGYKVTVTGTIKYALGLDPNAIADAEWAETTVLGIPGWTNPENAHMELLLNGQDIDWGPYSVEHIYTTEVLGNGFGLSFRISDDYYLDNEGYLIVKIEKI